ncbi:ketopantoate reductase family protein [Halostreptopolyspora alba]|uniref:2-dehydropantoate 2-reductase n=1 Tax=Halostreptopolyspora alba TaxID=2487137 RepID=A0A3N0E254_9ACTN|nr:2-dehydropantoate 2-reductase [Nocardiopsaceae bacterium YIM 96095]
MGPGGVGGLLAGLLAHRGHPVTVVATESTATRIATEGLRVESPTFGDLTARVTALPSLASPPDSDGGNHVVFVTPKATTLEAALDRVTEEATAGAVVVPLLNGFEHMDLLRRRLPRAHVTGAAIHVGATRDAPGHIRHTSPYTRIEIADSDAPEDSVADLAAALRDSGVEVELGASEDRVLWEKYGFLLPTALVCAHSGLPIGQARTRHRADMLGMVAEVAAVAEARGVPLDTERVIAMADDRPADTKPSMLFDRETGRPMELDPLGGALLRAAERAGVDTPVTARIVADLERVDRAATSAAP